MQPRKPVSVAVAQAGSAWRPWPLTNQDGRVVKALDLSSNGQMSAWVRTPLLVKVLRCRPSVQATVARARNPCDTATVSTCSRGQLMASCRSSSVLGGQPIGNTAGTFCGSRSNRTCSIESPMWGLSLCPPHGPRPLAHIVWDWANSRNEPKTFLSALRGPGSGVEDRCAVNEDTSVPWCNG